MKKTLIALAALAVVSAASAQSSVTLYGVVDMSVTQNKDSNTSNALVAGIGAKSEATKNGIANNVLSSSRLGFKGTEDLGGGLKANFVYELAITPDDTAGFGSTRVGTVGVSGDFGAVTIGRQYTPYHTVQAAMDLYGNVSAPGYVVANHNRTRSSNSVQYVSPSMSGFTVSALLGAGAESQVAPGSTAEGKDYGFAGVYAAGPLVAGFAYDEVTNVKTAGQGFKNSTSTPTSYVLSFTGDTVKTMAAGVSYDFAVVKASFAYSALTATPAALTAPIGTADTTSKGFNISLSAPMGAITLLANLGRANVVQDKLIDGKIDGFQIGANYALSKRTTAYALMGSEKASFDLLPTTGEFKKTQTSVGIRHTF